ncbi:ABC transporter substrate-binding protein [Acinetobacter apis]|uniref:Sulfonate transport system substrate-binding protein n=2 Tax=Acinetobacter apis TaxID=1229165 RepID=A0A217EFE8_9GAMM|nr:sulfonate transport system substrate-binding protein [Acinetobacter apis]
MRVSSLKKKVWQTSIALLMTAFLQNVYAQAPSVIRIASPDLTTGSKHAGSGVVDVLYTKHWIEQEFAKEHIQVEWHFFKGAGPAINEALANQQIDFAFLGDLPPIIGKAGGLDTQLLVPTARGLTNYLVVRQDVKVNNLQGLKGQRVGLLRGTADELSFVAALHSQGLTTKDVRLVNLDFNAVNAALAAQKIDASWGGSRFFALRDRKIVQLPLSTRQLNGAGASQGIFLGTTAFIQKHPQETQRVVNQVVKGLAWLSEDKNKVPQIAIFFTQSGYPASVYAQELNNVNLKFLYSPLFDAYYLGQLEEKIKLAHSQGLIRQPLDLKPWVNPTFVQHAISTLKLELFWTPTTHYAYLKH